MFAEQSIKMHMTAEKLLEFTSREYILLTIIKVMVPFINSLGRHNRWLIYNYVVRKTAREYKFGTE